MSERQDREPQTGEVREFVERLVAATNAHDIDALVECFATDYVNETPAHPERGFVGRAQVRTNWEQIFAFVPDVHAEVIRIAVDGDTAWTEYEMTGTRRDGTAHCMRGVILFGVRDRVAQWARFFLEPLDEAATTVDDAVRQQIVRR